MCAICDVGSVVYRRQTLTGTGLDCVMSGRASLHNGGARKSYSGAKARGWRVRYISVHVSSKGTSPVLQCAA